jgi:hypothetical protein
MGIGASILSDDWGYDSDLYPTRQPLTSQSRTRPASFNTMQHSTHAASNRSMLPPPPSNHPPGACCDATRAILAGGPQLLYFCHECLQNFTVPETEPAPTCCSTCQRRAVCCAAPPRQPLAENNPKPGPCHSWRTNPRPPAPLLHALGSSLSAACLHMQASSAPGGNFRILLSAAIS